MHACCKLGCFWFNKTRIEEDFLASSSWTDHRLAIDIAHIKQCSARCAKMLNLCWATSLLYPELTSAFWKILTLTICALLLKVLYIYWALLVLEANLAFASLHSHPGKGREVVPRCPCFCLQLFSVPRTHFPAGAQMGVALSPSVPFILCLSLFLWLELLNCGCHLKNNLCVFLIWVYCEDRVFSSWKINNSTESS